MGISNIDMVKPLDEWVCEQCEAENSKQGNLTDYNCDKCKNRGYISKVENLTIITYRCECMNIRETFKRIKQSGFGEATKRCTLDSFKTDSKLTKRMKEIALNYLEDIHKGTDLWMFVGGQSGAGKTHLCTAISVKLIESGKTARYMVWPQDAPQIKANINDGEVYASLVGDLKKTDVLYIDDLFKSGEEKGERAKPSAADVRLAFEIINFRVMQPRAITIISSELAIDEIIAVDSALGSRIKQMSTGYIMNIPNKEEYNYRLREV